MPASVQVRSALLRIASVAAALLCASCGMSSAASHRPAAAAPPAARTPAPGPTLPDPTESTIGPLFGHGVTGTHHCTASVLDSPGGDLILTAAHCVAGSGAGMLFA